MIELEMIHGALPRHVVAHRRRTRAPGGGAHSEARSQPVPSSGPLGMGEWDVSRLDYEQMLRRCEAAGMPRVPPYPARIEDDTSIDSLALAEQVCREVSRWLGEDFPREWAAELAERANVVYRHNARFRGRVRRAGGAGQDYLVAFMRHWLCALLQSRRPGLRACLKTQSGEGEAPDEP